MIPLTNLWWQSKAMKLFAHSRDPCHYTLFGPRFGTVYWTVVKGFATQFYYLQKRNTVNVEILALGQFSRYDLLGENSPTIPSAYVYEVVQYVERLSRSQYQNH